MSIDLKQEIDREYARAERHLTISRKLRKQLADAHLHISALKKDLAARWTNDEIFEAANKIMTGPNADALLGALVDTMRDNRGRRDAAQQE